MFRDIYHKLSDDTRWDDDDNDVIQQFITALFYGEFIITAFALHVKWKHLILKTLLMNKRKLRSV